MIDSKTILLKLANHYGGELLEKFPDSTPPEPIKYWVQITFDGFFFMMESHLKPGESPSYLRDRTCDQLVWLILQKGVEFAKEKGEIHKMFNPDTNHE